MGRLACDHIAGRTFGPWFGRMLTPAGLEQMIRSAFDLAGGHVEPRPDGDHLYLDWQADGVGYTAGIHAESLLFVSIRLQEGALTAGQVIECMGVPAYYQAWYQSHPARHAGSVQVAMIFFAEKVVAYAAQHYTTAAAQPPALDDSLPVHLIGVFGQDWQDDPRALNKALPWPGWQQLEIETIG